MRNRKLLEWGGVAGGLILIGFGIGALVLAVGGHNEVPSQLEREADRRLAGHDARGDRQGGSGGGPPRRIELPTCNVADEAIDTGSEAKCFAELHADPCARDHRRPTLQRRSASTCRLAEPERPGRHERPRSCAEG